jgi:hypothetical protein
LMVEATARASCLKPAGSVNASGETLLRITYVAIVAPSFPADTAAVSDACSDTVGAFASLSSRPVEYVRSPWTTLS